MKPGGLLIAVGVVIGNAVSQPCQAQIGTSPLVNGRADQQPSSVARRLHRTVAPKTPRTMKSAALAPFRLTGLQVEGSSLPPDVLREAVNVEIGREIGPDDLTRICERIAKIYETRSDIAIYDVSVPDEQPGNGVLRVVVTEGFIEDVRVNAPAHAARHPLLNAYAAKLAAERPLRRSTLERYISLIRDMAGLNPAIQFVAGHQPGGLELVVDVKPKRIEAGFGIDNRGVHLLGRTQVELDAQLHGLIREGDDTRLTFAFPADWGRFRYYAISHSQPIGTDGATAQASFGYLKTRPSFYDLHGRAIQAGVQVTAPVLRRYKRSLYLTFGLDGVNSDNALFGQALSSDRTRAARANITFTSQSSRFFLLANVGASFGIGGLGARTLMPASTDLSGRKLNLKLNANLALLHDVVLRLDGAAQLTSDRLAGSEQFALGGEEFGRAFEAAALVGDRGVAGSAEVAWKTGKLPALLQGSELYMFGDAGSVRSLARPDQPASSRSLSSVGGGGRVSLASKVVVQVEASRGLNNPIPTEDHRDWRTIFSVKSLF